MRRPCPASLPVALIALCCLHAASAHAFSIATVGGKEVRWSIFDVGYYLDSDGWSGITNGSDRAAVTKSFEDWAAVSCSKLQFHKLGDTTVTSVLPVGGSANGKNELIWKEGYWPFGSYVLGVTSPLYSFTGVISEADIAFNGTIKWNTSGNMWNSCDVKSVAIHEIGHFFGLQHNLSFNENDPPTMAPYADPNGKSATLHQDDMAAICFLYPKTSYTCTSAAQCPYVVEDNSQGEEYYAMHYKCSGGSCVPDTGSSNPNAGELGAKCNKDKDCKSPLFCVQTVEGNWCSQWCSVKGQNCPGDFTCFLVEEGNDEGLCAGGLQNVPFGEYCFNNSDCMSPYFCLNWWSGPFCTKDCTDVDGGTGCPAGYTCYPSAEAPKGPGACFQGTVTKKENGKSCNYSSDCKSGMCFPNPGETSKYCRASCDPEQSSCSAGTKCIALPGDITGTKGGCIPLDLLPEKKVGADCDSGWQCQSSYCYYDSELGYSACRQLCDPAVGNCPAGQACFAIGAGKGVCLLAPDPQPEGAACQHHHGCLTGFCVALPGTDKKICRNACTLGSGCKGGYTCIFFSDAQVGACMPDGKEVGAGCFSSTECTTQICWAPEGNYACLLPCQVLPCPAGYHCQEGSPYGPVCLEQAGSLVDGVSCASSNQCVSSICLNGICRSPCSVTGGGCPTGLGCVSLAGGDAGACVSPGSLAQGSSCDNDFQCASLLCVELPKLGRKCAAPCLPGGTACAAPLICQAADELDGLGYCGQPAAEPEIPGDDPGDDPGGEPGGEPGGGQGGEEEEEEVPVASGGLCSAGGTGNRWSAVVLGLLLLVGLTVARRSAGDGREESLNRRRFRP